VAEPLLRLEGVRSGYGPTEILKGVSLEVARGEIVTLIGANGAGKSTMLNTICGVVRARAGRITLEGRDLTRLATDQIAGLGIAQVPEGRRVFAEMTVLENLELGAYLRRDRAGIRGDLDKVFALFPVLAQRRRQPAGSLSGGEQQMLAMARGVMARPRVLLLDEPSLGLAPKLVLTVFEIIRDLHRQGSTLLLVEQNAYMALRTADRGYVMETGRITLAGPAAELLNKEEVRRAYLGECGPEAARRAE
jgi:branched-chain amino acid transport system ATP-binding protein